MKRICFVTTIYMTYKAFLKQLSQYLHDTGEYDISLICAEEQEAHEDVPDFVHYFPVKMERGVSLSMFESIKQIQVVLEKEKFDIVQYSTPNAAFYTSIAAKKAKAPVRLYCQWGIRYIGLSGMKRKIFKLIEKIVCRNSTDVRAVSPLNKEFAVSEGLYKEEKATVVGHGGTIGVDSQIYDIGKKSEWRKEIRNKYGISEDDFVFGFAGRISADKGCRELF